MMILAIVGGAFLGGILRFLIAQKSWPLWGTWLANMIACLLLGWASSSELSPLIVALLGTGVAGALSTWSTLAKELGGLIKEHRTTTFCGYLIATIVGGVLFALIGTAI